ncbi:MAG: hypothetical protein LUD15_00865 [Bacteroides sp.]|nr:hypothetical protein [Bacteroides sp.]
MRIIILIINIRMIGQLVRMSGFRPSWTQLCRIYLEVVLASFITDLSENFLEEIDFSALLSSFKIPIIFVKSVIDGSLSALMTLRIGYITRLYLVRGTDAQTVTDRLLRRSIRQQAIKQSVMEYPSVLMEGMGKIKSTTGCAFGNWFKGFSLGSFWGGKSE